MNSAPDRGRQAASTSQAFWMPLRLGGFRGFWAASLVAMIGGWMLSVGGAWMMTDLSPAPLMVASMQTAIMAPGLLFALPLGALVDRHERRSFLLMAVGWQATILFALAFFATTGWLSAWALLALTFLCSIGGVAQSPASSAALRDLVPRDDLPNAIVLNSLSVNASRALGPVLAGVIVGIAGVAAVFWLSAVLSLVLFCTVLRWRPQARPEPSDGFWRSMLDGVRHAIAAGPFRIILLRGATIFLLGGVNVVLLPVLARGRFGATAAQFGVLMAAMGVGAMAMAMMGVALLRARLTPEGMLVLGGAAAAALLVGLALTTNFAFMLVMLAAYGAAWMLTLFSYQLAAQLILPPELVGRGLSISTMVFMGSMALGGLVWGRLAEWMDLSHVYAIAALALALAGAADRLFARSRRVAAGEPAVAAAAGTLPFSSEEPAE